MSEMIERVTRAIEEAVQTRGFFVRRKIDKSGYEVVHDLDPGGSVSDETIKVIYEGTEFLCNGMAAELHNEAVARAAIKAMREPTEAMLKAPPAPEDQDGLKYDPLDDFLDNWSAEEVWRAMIDAALKE